MIKLLQTLLTEFKDNFAVTKTMQLRDIVFPDMPNKIKVAIGMRRVGKTFFLFQTIDKLIKENNIPWHRFLHLNFEDDRLLPCSQKQLRQLLESFYKLYPDNHENECYLFLDEIQNVDDWALVIRRFFDSKKVQIYLSGSSAKLLSKEIATSLRGRSIAIEIWPYSFKEYLSAHKVKYEKKLLSQKTKDALNNYFQQYMMEGGFPETIALNSSDRRKILQDYVEVVIMRDIVERHRISNISLVRYILKALLKNISSSFSINKFSNDIKSQGFSSAKNTVYDYLSYIEEAYLIFSVPLFSESLRKVQSNPKKIYAIDPGLVQAYTLSLNDNYGALFENIIFLDLKRRGHKIYYYLTQERYEIDFLTEDPEGKINLYQVAWDVNNEQTMEREMRALKAAENELQIEGQLITPENYIEMIYAQ